MVKILGDPSDVDARRASMVDHPYRFDWYQATLRDDRVGGAFGDRLVAELEASCLGTAETHPGMWGYGSRVDVRAGGDVVARVLHGGTQPWPSIWASGDATDKFVPWLRSAFPVHRVTRCDSAADFLAAGSWDKLSAVALEVADEHKLKVSQAGDWHRLEDGRTLYIGSRKSPVFARLYEKGKQVNGETVGTDAPRVTSDWVRLELQVRPVKEAKGAVAVMSPDSIWGLSSWSRELAAAVTDTDVERVSMSAWRPADDERAWAYMLRQYGPLLARRRAAVGSWEAVGRALGREIDRAAGVVSEVVDERPADPVASVPAHPRPARDCAVCGRPLADSIRGDRHVVADCWSPLARDSEWRGDVL